MPKVQEIAGQYTITIPKDKVIQAGLSKGDTLAIDYDKRTGELILSKIKTNP